MSAEPPRLEHGMMAVSGGHEVYWETAGNPDGIPAIVLHGGPGSGCRPGHYTLFDLNKYRVILMDQRGCGRSRPLASETLDGLTQNTTDDLLADIRQLKGQLGIEAWVVAGGSWGSTLALLYAQEDPASVLHLVLSGVATTARRELAWLYDDVGAFFPEAYEQFAGHVGTPKDVWALLDAYGDALADVGRAQAAADAWCTWELAIFEQDFAGAGAPWTDPAFRLGFARIVTHYFRNFMWREDTHVARHMDRLEGVSGVMVHSRFDPSCPLRGVWELAKLWPAARLEVLGQNAHSALSGAMRERLLAATDAFAATFEG